MRDGFKLANILILDSSRFEEVNVRRVEDLPNVAAEGREILGKEKAFSMSQTLSIFEANVFVCFVDPFTSRLRDIAVDGA
jgi:hypothetical protein